MSTETVFRIGRTRRMKDEQDEVAIKQLVEQLQSIFTTGTEAPTRNTAGRIYFQTADGSFTRPWFKDVNGNWK